MGHPIKDFVSVVGGNDGLNTIRTGDGDVGSLRFSVSIQYGDKIAVVRLSVSICIGRLRRIECGNTFTVLIDPLADRCHGRRLVAYIVKNKHGMVV